jgi:energy-coupling factor transporter transmembrane protein EcfT
MPTNNEGRPDPLGRLSRLNPVVVLLGTMALFLAVLFAPDWLGAILILLIAGGLVALLRLTWPVLAPRARAMRVLVIVLLLAIAGLKLFT